MSEELCRLKSKPELKDDIGKTFSPGAADEIMRAAMTANNGGGMKGGVNCNDIASITKYLALFAITIAAGCAVKSIPLGKAFDAENFKHLWDYVGKFQLGMGFVDRTTGYITTFFTKQPDINKMPNSLKNFISIWCQFETDKKLDNAKKSLENLIIPAPLDTPVTIQSINDLIIDNNNALLTKIREMVVDRQLAVVGEGERILKEELERKKALDDEDDDLEFKDTSEEDQNGGKKSKRRRGRKLRKTRVLRKKRR